MVSMYDSKVKGRKETLQRMKKLGDQVVNICMSIAAKLRRCNMKKLKGSSNQTRNDQNNQAMEDQNRHIDAKTMNTSSLRKSNSTSTTSAFRFQCLFCAEKTPLLEAFHIKGCNHFFCPPCIVKFVVSKLRDDITSIMCPHSSCKTGVLDLEYCRRILPTDVTDQWQKALSENNNNNYDDHGLPSEEYFNCPYKACGARLTLNQLRDYEKIHQKTVKRELLSSVSWFESTYNKYLCCSCNRALCVKCRIPYHSNFGCLLYQKMKVEGGGEDMILIGLAKKKGWKRCPCCNYFVILEDSSCRINYVTCWCGYSFCYNCLRNRHYYDEGQCKTLFPAHTFIL